MLQTLFLKKNREEGQGLVEYALVLPIFLLIVFFIIDFSMLLYDKVSFNMALREAIFDIEFRQDDIKKFQEVLNPFGGRPNRYGLAYNPYTGEYSNQKRGQDYYMDEPFLDGLTVADYLRKEIKARDDSIDVDRIEFLNFDGDRESKIGIYSGLQHYHYKSDENGGYAATPNFSTIVISQMRVRYKIEPRGGFMKSLYPDGIPHEKVIYKASRNFRWEPRVVNLEVTDELESLKNTQGGI